MGSLPLHGKRCQATGEVGPITAMIIHDFNLGPLGRHYQGCIPSRVSGFNIGPEFQQPCDQARFP